MPKVLNPDETYTFAKYFDLPFAIDDILADLDCTYALEELQLPYYQTEINLPGLERRIQRNLRIADLTSEIARREVIIAPILLEICDQLDQRLRIEYAISVSNWLKGTLDYYIASANTLLVIEAKLADLTRGFTQLATQLVALDQWTNSTAPILYGAVTTGRDWQFGKFDRQARHIVQDLKLYRVPEELALLTQILAGTIAS